MTTQTFSELAAELDAIKAGAAERTEQATDQRQAAEQHRTEADQLAAEAELTAKEGHAEASRRLGQVLRGLGDEVAGARQAAIDAVGCGEGVLDGWMRYRLTAARARGRWAALAGSYQAITGRQAPDGPHRPELRAEPFETFLLNAVGTAEVATRREAHREAERELRQHRTA